jgi:hypothetical protein
MPVSERESWLLNFYRNSELHGALLMGRLARTVADPDVLVPATRHCATEARHAAMLSDTLHAVGATIDPRIQTVQEHYAAHGGVPSALIDVLVLSEVLERRVLTTYRAHVARPGTPAEIARTLRDILSEMEAEDHGERGSWIEHALERRPREQVEAAERRWRAVDEAVVIELHRMFEARWAPGAGRR